MDIKEIKAIIDLMAKNGLSEFELEKEDFKIRVKRAANGEFSSQVSSYQPPLSLTSTQYTQQQPIVEAPAKPSTPATPAPAVAGPTINSPMVGTFYSAPSPDAPAFVSVGSEVNEDTVVCIIEAMKVMNEIKAEMKGTITKVVAENGKPVEFGSPLFHIQPR